MSLSNVYENRVYDWLYRAAQSPTRPAGVWVALFTAAADPEAGTATEVAGGSYARQPVTMTAPTDGAGSNAADVTFPVPSANWGTITHFAFMDAVSGGSPISAITPLAAPRVISSSDAAPRLAAGALTAAQT